MQKYYAQLYCNKIDNLNAMGKFCKKIIKIKEQLYTYLMELLLNSLNKMTCIY